MQSVWCYTLAVLYLLLGLEGLRLFVWRNSPLWCFCHDRRCVLNFIRKHPLIVWVVQEGAISRILSSSTRKITEFIFPTIEPYICHYENKTNKWILKYLNLLHFNPCEPPTCFSHLLWPYLMYSTWICASRLGRKKFNMYKVLRFSVVYVDV